MSPASWAHLLYGGAYCYVSKLCSNKSSTIKYKPHGPELRRETSNQGPVFISPSCVQVLHHNPVSPQPCYRARTGSLILHSLRCSSSVSQEYKDMIRSESSLFNCSRPRALTESLLGSVGKPCCTRHWWDEDVMAFETELDALKRSVGDLADAGASISAFLARKKEGVTTITEVSFISVGVRACLIIVHPSMLASVQRGRKTAIQIVAPNYLTSGLNALKSKRYISLLGHGSRDPGQYQGSITPTRVLRGRREPDTTAP